MPKYFSSKLIKFLVLITLCLFLVFLNPKGTLSPVRNFFLSLAYPFQKAFYLSSNSMSKWLYFFGSVTKLKGENERLIKENYALNSELASLREEKRENEILREQMELAAKKKFDLEAAFVIGQDLQARGSWIEIDKGTSSGIQSGMPVVFSGNILVGRISEVNFNNSRVDLLSNSSSAVSAFDLETGAKGVVKGEYDLGMIMDMISQDEIVNIGDTIVTSNLSGNFPKGLFLGKVQEIKPSDDGLFQKAVIVPATKYSKMEIVFVIKN